MHCCQTSPNWQRDRAAPFTVSVVSRGAHEANRTLKEKYALSQILVQADREVASAYVADARPSAVLVDRDGAIGSPVAVGERAMRALVTSIRNKHQGIARIPVVHNRNNGHGESEHYPPVD
jgi:hypothetical protein